MRKVKVSFERETLSIEFDNQKSTETVDELRSMRAAAMDAVGLSEYTPTLLELDFEQGTAKLTLEDGSEVERKDPDLSKKEGAFFDAIGFGQADITNAAEIISAFMSGEITADTMNILFDLEGQQMAQNPVVTEALDIIKQRRGS